MRKHGIKLGLLISILCCFSCKEKQYGELLKDGFDLGKQVKSWDMKALSQGFDFEKYSVFTYAK